MAGNPITWRNINAPSFGGVNQGLALSTQSISNGLNQITNAARGVQTNRQNAIDERTETNTNNLLNRIAGAQDFDTLNALQQQLTPEGLSQYGDEIDLGRLLSAANNREGAIRTNRIQDYDYKQTVKAQNQAPLIEQANQLMAQGNYGEARSLATKFNLGGDLINTISQAEELATNKADQETLKKNTQTLNDFAIEASKNIKDPAALQKAVLAKAGELNVPVTNSMSALGTAQQLNSNYYQPSDTERQLGANFESNLQRTLEGVQNQQRIGRLGVSNITEEEAQAWNNQMTQADLLGQIANQSDNNAFTNWFDGNSAVAADVFEKKRMEIMDTTIDENRSKEDLERVKNLRQILSGRFNNEIPTEVFRRAFESIKGTEEDWDWSKGRLDSAIDDQLRIFVGEMKEIAAGRQYDKQSENVYNTIRTRMMDEQRRLLAEEQAKRQELLR